MNFRRQIPFQALVLLAALLAPLPSRAATTALLQSTEKDRTDLELTVYNDNFALVRDVRSLDIKAGTGTLEFRGVPATVIPETILLRPLERKSGFTILEQSFRYDLLSKKSLLDRYVGKKIRLEIWNRFNDRVSSVEATLLSNSPDPVYKIGDEIYIGHHGVRVLPALPDDLVTRPRISWLYSAPGDAAYRLEASYLAEQIKWKARYQLILQGEQGAARLAGWVSLTNGSGAAFTGAKVRFAAGRPHRVTRPYRRSPGFKQRARGYDTMLSETAQPVESPLFEYHVYDLGRKITINNNEQKQLSLIKARGIEVQKELEMRGRRGYFTAPLRSKKTLEPVYVYVKFTNSAANHLGIPLPAGTIDLYMEGSDGKLEFIGEDNIDHTPGEREVRLKAGLAFDVTAERTQTGFSRVSSVLYDTEWEIKLGNNKAEGVTVNIVEPLSGSWDIVTSSHPYTKIDAFTIRFEVPVPAGQEVTVTYRARVEL